MEHKTHTKTGVIGLGSMGAALADALLSSEFDVVVWNRSPEKFERFSDTKAVIAASVEDTASQCDLLVVCLTDHAASMGILDSGVVADQLKSKSIVLVSTISADESMSTAEWVDRHGIAYLAGSILGYPDDVRNQQCMIVYSGPKAVFESCQSVLEALGGMPRWVGESTGIAPQFDKAIYSSYYAHSIGLFHGALICERIGAPLEVFVEATTSWDWSAHNADLLERIRKRDYSAAEATMDIHAAAYSHIPPLCKKLGISESLPSAISGYFESALKRGYTDSGLSALIEVLGKEE